MVKKHHAKNVDINMREQGSTVSNIKGKYKMNTVLTEKKISDKLSKIMLSDSDIRYALFRYCFNMDSRITRIIKNYSDSDEEMTNQIAMHIVECANKKPTVQKFTTGELSMIFGVSITTINNWINANRFTQVEKKSTHKQSRIPITASFVTHSGELVPLHQIYTDRMLELKESRKNVDAAAIKSALNRDIMRFEAQYGGSYESTLALKTDKTEDDLENEGKWLYLIERQRRYDQKRKRC